MQSTDDDHDKRATKRARVDAGGGGARATPVRDKEAKVEELRNMVRCVCCRKVTVHAARVAADGSGNGNGNTTKHVVCFACVSRAIRDGAYRIACVTLGTLCIHVRLPLPSQGERASPIAAEAAALAYGNVDLQTAVEPIDDVTKALIRAVGLLLDENKDAGSDDDVRPFACTACNESLADLGALVRHYTCAGAGASLCPAITSECDECRARVPYCAMERHLQLHRGHALLARMLTVAAAAAAGDDEDDDTTSATFSQWCLAHACACAACGKPVQPADADVDAAAMLVRAGAQTYHAACLGSRLVLVPVAPTGGGETAVCTRCDAPLTKDGQRWAVLDAGRRWGRYHPSCIAAVRSGIRAEQLVGWSAVDDASARASLRRALAPAAPPPALSIPVHPPSFPPSLSPRPTSQQPQPQSQSLPMPLDEKHGGDDDASSGTPPLSQPRRPHSPLVLSSASQLMLAME